MKSKKTRKPTEDEIRLLEFLFRQAKDITISSDWKKTIQVQNMDDEGMGSLLLFENGIVSKEREFGSEVASCYFQDIDNVTVSAALNVDTNGKIFEMDIWKTDFTPLIKIATKFEV